MSAASVISWMLARSPRPSAISRTAAAHGRSNAPSIAVVTQPERRRKISRAKRRQQESVCVRLQFA